MNLKLLEIKLDTFWENQNVEFKFEESFIFTNSRLYGTNETFTEESEQLP